MLVLTYVEAYQATGEPLFAQTAHETLGYVQRDMTSPEGAFYSAEDADSEGVEGKFYVWTRKELDEVLGEDLAAQVAETYQVRPEGNFHEEATGILTGENILHLTGSSGAVPDSSSWRERLFAHREKRVHPLKDDKVLTDWNGLMIAAMARAARVLDAPEYTEAAVRAAEFVAQELTREGDYLNHAWRNGEARVPAFLDDYAYMAWGLLELYETTYEPLYLERAKGYNEVVLKHFGAPGGALYQTPDDGEALVARPSPYYDGPTPSGNAVTMQNCLRLSRLLFDPALEKAAWGIAGALQEPMASHPTSVAASVSTLDYALGPAYEVVLVGALDSSDMQKMVSALTKCIPSQSGHLAHSATDKGRRDAADRTDGPRAPALYHGGQKSHGVRLFGAGLPPAHDRCRGHASPSRSYPE